MDEVIYLELDEEIPSVIEKMKSLSGKSVALVIPKGAAIIQSVINLKILKKEAEVLKKDIALVTQDRIGRNLASQVGLSVYDSIRSSRPIINPTRPEPESSEIIELDLSQKQSSKPKGVSVHDYQSSPVQEEVSKPKPFFKKQIVNTDASPNYNKSNFSESKTPSFSNSGKNSNKKHIGKILILLLIILVAIGLLYFFLPSAQINLIFQSEPFETELEILVDNNINKIDESRNAVPGELIEIEKQEIKTFPSTGTKDLGEKASGTIKLSNGTGVEQSLAAGTTFTANGLKFVSTESVTVPKATASVDAGGNVVKSAGAASVKVQASEAGDKYNIRPSSFSVNASVSAESSAAMSGGVSKKIKIVTEDDINKAKDEIKKLIIEKNIIELTNKIGKKKFFDSTITHDEISFSSNKTINSEGENFEVRITVKSRTIAYNENEYREVITLALNKNVPDDKEVILSETDEIHTISGNTDFSEGILKLNQKINTHTGPKIDEENIKNSVKGKKIFDAENKIKQDETIKTVDIEIKPSWWPKTLPRLTRRIKVEKKVEKSNTQE